MKRCPQCEFIYEDDQNLCDMDGVLLVSDSRTLPNLHALATVPAALPVRVQRRSRLVPAFATVILTLLAASVYYVSSQRAASNAPASVITAPAEAPAAVAPAEPSTPPAPAPESDKREIQPPPSSSTKPTAAPAKNAATKAATKPTTKPTGKPAAAKPEPKKENSKVSSILKKTGRILKKPFQF